MLKGEKMNLFLRERFYDMKIVGFFFPGERH